MKLLSLRPRADVTNTGFLLYAKFGAFLTKFGFD